MKLSTWIVGVLAAGILAAGVEVRPRSATAASNPLDVNVANVPLPVTGTIGISGTPAVTISGTPSVNVASSPLPGLKPYVLKVDNQTGQVKNDTAELLVLDYIYGAGSDGLSGLGDYLVVKSPVGSGLYAGGQLVKIYMLPGQSMTAIIPYADVLYVYGHYEPLRQ